MKLRLRYGVMLLALVLVGVAISEGTERLALIAVAMGLALWAAFSLPTPPPKPQERDWIEMTEEGEGDQNDLADNAPPKDAESAPEGSNGSGEAHAPLSPGPNGGSLPEDGR